MATTGRGNWPLFSSWFTTYRAVTYNRQTAAADGPDNLVWSDWFFEPGGGGVALEGTSQLVIVTTSLLTAVASLDATSVLVVSTTSLLTATVGLLSISTLVVATTADLSTTAALVSESQVSVTGALLLTSLAALQGSLNLDVVTTSLLQSTAALSSTVNLAVVTSPVLISTANLISSSSLVISTLGLLTVQANLVGSVDFVVLTTGVLSTADFSTVELIASIQLRVLTVSLLQATNLHYTGTFIDGPISHEIHRAPFVYNPTPPPHIPNTARLVAKRTAEEAARLWSDLNEP